MCRIQPELTQIDPVTVSQKICNNLYHGVETSEIDTMASLTAAALGSQHYEYQDLAGRLTISNLQKQVPYDLDSYLTHTQEHLADETVAIFRTYKDRIETELDPERDFLISFFGCKTL
jgi:hypothetical protein